MKSQTQYRLSWSTPDSWACAATEDSYGKGCWPRLTDAQWDELPGWHRIEVVFTGNERMEQYHTLKQWMEKREQPVRDVRLERREIAPDDAGWEAVPDAAAS